MDEDSLDDDAIEDDDLEDATDEAAVDKATGTIAEVSTTAEKVLFDGPALQQGSMDVRDLAPALLELGALCERVNELLNGDRAAVSVNVRSDFVKGSFAVNIEVVQTAFESIKTFLFSQSAQDAKYIWEVISTVSGAGGGLLLLYKKLRGRAAKHVKEEGDKASITINNTTIVVPVVVARLYEDDMIRSRIEGTLRPLLRPGIETFDIFSGGEVVEQVTKTEAEEAAEARRTPESDFTPPILDTTHEAALEIVKVPFKTGLVWNFSMGKTKVSAEMRDDQFLRRHQSGETSFSAGDILLVMLRTRSWQGPSGLKVEHSVERVLNHVHRAQQRMLGEGEPVKGDSSKP